MMKPTLVATFIKLIAIAMMLGSPATASCYTMAKSMGHEGTLSSSIIMLTTVLSAFTMTVIVFILKSMGMI